MTDIQTTSLGWAPTIPAHWRVVPLNFVARMGTGHTPDRNKKEYWENCTVPWVTTTDVTRRADSLTPLMETEQKISELGMANSAAVLHPEGTVMLSRTASVGYSVRIGRPMATTQAFVTWQAGPDLDPRYLLLVLRAMRQEWQKLAYGSTHLTIYMPDLESIRIPLPPLEEQRRIADFLDAETARIDQLSTARFRQLSLIGERYTAHVLDAIRGSLESSQRRKAGPPWLGEVPVDWPVVPVNYHFEVILGKMLNPDSSRGDHLRHYLRNANVQWDRIDTTDLQVMNFPPEERQRFQVQSGDLLVCEGGEPGRAAIWNGEIGEIYYQKALHRVRARGDDSPRWLYYCLRAATAQNVFAIEGNATTIAHLTGEQLRAQRFPFPAPDVQERLVKDLDLKAKHLEKLQRRVDQQLDLLAERRQALITAAVTGQFDVSTASGRGVTEGVGV